VSSRNYVLFSSLHVICLNDSVYIYEILPDVDPETHANQARTAETRLKAHYDLNIFIERLGLHA